MKPPPFKLDGDRTVFKELELQATGTVPAGRVMWCRGRKVLGYADVAGLGNIFEIPRGCNTMCVSPADHADLLAWLAGSGRNI
jgi:hypothetical protein